MGLRNSFYSGVSGLVTMGNAMQVIGDNISNVNTMGFKGGRATFQDIMAQSINTARGGSQVGRGSAMADVAPLFSQGSFESTASSTDLAIAGNGFFMVSDPKVENSIYYSRAGQFHVDQYGYLVNPASLRVQGWEMETQPGGSAEIVDSMGDIQIANSSAPVATTQATVAINVDSRITGPLSSNSLAADWVGTQADLTPNVHYEHKTTFNIYDSLGNTHEMTLFFDRTSTEREWEFLVTMDPADDRSGLTGNDRGMLMRGYVSFTPQGQIDAIYSKTVTGLQMDIDGDTLTDQLDTPFPIESLDSIPATGIPITVTDTGGPHNYTLMSYDPTTGTVTIDTDGDGVADPILDTDGDGTPDNPNVPISTSTSNIMHYTVQVTGLNYDNDGDTNPDTMTSEPFEIEQLYEHSLPAAGLTVDFVDGVGAPYTVTIMSYDHDNGTVDLDTNGDGIVDVQGVSLFSGGQWTEVSYGDHNYPELKAYFIPPSGSIDQVTGEDLSAQPVEINFGAMADVTRTLDALGNPVYTVNGWRTEAITTTQYANRSNTLFYDQNGFGAGFLETVNVDSEGVISGSYSNGRIISLAQVGLAKFTSPTDLAKEGGNLWRETTASGAPVTGPPRTNGLGSIASNALEQSTVDISTEFVRLITTQRAFQANSRIITTTDELLSELLNMKR